MGSETIDGPELPVAKQLQPISTSQLIFRAKNPEGGCFKKKKKNYTSYFMATERERLADCDQHLKTKQWRMLTEDVRCQLQSNESDSTCRALH